MKTLACMMYILIPVFVMATPLGVSAEDVTEEIGNIEIKPYDLVIVTSGLTELYQQEQLGTLAVDGTATPSQTFATLTDAETAYQGSLVDLATGASELMLYFTSNDVISNLSSEDVAALIELFDAGALVGVNSADSSTLRGILGMDESRYLIDDIGVGTSSIYFIYRSEELFLPIDGLTVEQILKSALAWTNEIDTNATDRAGSPWLANGSQEIRRTTSKGNEVRYRIELYKLESSAYEDWYRFDFMMTSTVKSYQCKIRTKKIVFVNVPSGTNCGWYTGNSNLSVELKDGASLYEYAPNVALTDRTSSFTIGGNLGGSSDGPNAGINASYTKNYSFPDMKISDTTSFVTNTVKWQASFNGPDYDLYPISIGGPAEAARGTYTWNPSIIASVPKGKVGTICIYPEIKYFNDDLTYKGLTLEGTRYIDPFFDLKCYKFGPTGLM